MIVTLAVAAGICGAAGPLRAQVLSAAGSATIAFGPASCDSIPTPPPQSGRAPAQPPSRASGCAEPSASELQEVRAQAVMNALARYAAAQGQSTQANFDRVRAAVAARLDDFVLGVLELGRQVDTTSRRLTMEVSIDLNEARLRNVVQAASATGSISQREQPIIGLFLLARQQSEVEQFDAERRTTNQTRATSATESSRDSVQKHVESARLVGGTVTLRDSVSAGGRAQSAAEQGRESVSRASSTIRADRLGFAVVSAADLNAVLGGDLAVEGFETVDGAFLEDAGTPPLLDALRADFGVADDVTAATLRRLTEAVRAQDVPLVLVGTVTLGMPGRDEVSGNQRVFAKVSAKVYDVSGRVPRTVLNVPPEQHAGLGPDASVASTNALKSAGRAIAREMIARLYARDDQGEQPET